MSLQLLDHPLSSNRVSLQRAILETLAYSDIFDYPLLPEEILRYLSITAPRDELQAALDDGVQYVDCLQGYYFLAGRELLVALRRQRERSLQRTLQVAYRIGRLMSSLPFIRMVALTGSLALLNSGDGADLDYMLVTSANRVWTARGFALLLGRLTSRWGYKLCPNLIVSERRLEWSDRNIYSAREICQMLPISGMGTYSDLRFTNAWTEEYLPNAGGMPLLGQPVREPSVLPRRVQEWPLRGRLGDRVENWERTRKIGRFSRQSGFGTETTFGPDICQGNFDHHGARTREALQERLSQLGIHPSDDSADQLKASIA